MPMIISTKWNIFDNLLSIWSFFQDAFDIFKKPWLIPFADIVNLYFEEEEEKKNKRFYFGLFIFREMSIFEYLHFDDQLHDRAP